MKNLGLGARGSFVIAVLVFTLCLPASTLAFKGEIVVPCIFDATGPNSAGDLPIQKLRYAVTDWWNKEKGGVAGYKLVMKGIDFGFDMSKCMTIYKGLAAEGYPAVIISASAPAVLVKSLAIDKKIVTLMAPNCDVCYLAKDQKESYLFSVMPMYYDIYRTFVHYIMEVDWPKQGKDRKPVIGGFNADASFGKDVDKGVRVTCEKFGIEYVPTWCKFGITEATSQVALLKKAGCDYVIGMQLMNESMVIEKECARMDYHPQLLLHGPHLPAAVKAGYAINAWGYNFAGGLDTPGGKVAQMLWKKHTPEENMSVVQWPFGFCMPLYTIMERVIEKGGIKGLTGEAIKTEFETLRNEDVTDGLTAPWTFTQRDHSGPRALKFEKCLDNKGNVYRTPWIEIPEKTPEEMTLEYYKR